jgi:MiaB/RimO family radical SAM methylthiotransferase
MATSRLEVPEQTFFFNPMTISSLERELMDLSLERSSSHAPGLSKTPEVCLIRVSTGCLSQCTFCAIPNAAGRTKSRSIPDIVSEVNSLVQGGAGSFLLTSEDVGAYGLDIGVSYAGLVSTLLQETKAELLSIDTLNPRWLFRTLPQTIHFLGSKRVSPLLYVPVQSGSDKILRRMARGYTSNDVRYILDSLSKERPDVRLVTDFIVGFPGETEADFEATRTIFRDYRSSIQYVEVFKYTERPGTAATRFADPVPDPVRDQRARVLLADVLEARLRAQGIGTREGLFSFLSSRKRLSVNTNLDVGTPSAPHQSGQQNQQFVQLRG